MRCGQSERDRGRVPDWLIILLLFLLIMIVFVLPHWRGKPDYAIGIRQKAQLHSLDAALELFDNEYGGYPPSDTNDVTGSPYCGAMKLAEAVMGRDLLGFHTQSAFRADGLDPDTLAPLYPAGPSQDNLKARKGPFLQTENANAHRLVDIYGKGNSGRFHDDLFVLCDTFARRRPSGKKTGMPILYYRADSSGTAHDADHPDDPNNVYDYRDNHALVALGVPGEPNAAHPLIDPRRFYLNTRSDKILTLSRPSRPDSYILISAGRDGLYGTADDICNFAWKYRE
jgi:hypothetical protein